MRSIKTFFFVLCGALLFGLWWVQHDQRCLDFAQESMERMFDTTLHATFRGVATHLDIARLSVTYQHVLVMPHDTALQWQWKADELVISLSLLPYFYEKAFGLFIKVKNLTANSVVHNGYPTILQHVHDMVKAPPLILPLVFDGISFINGHITCQSDDKKWHFSSAFQSDSGRSKNILKSRFSLLDASLFYDKKPIAKDMQGVCSSAIDMVSGKSSAQWDSTFILNVLPQDEQQSYFSGTWQHNKFDGVLHNHQRTFSCVPFTGIKNTHGWDVLCDGMIALDAFKNIFFSDSFDTMQGMFAFSFSGNTHKVIQGSVTIENGGVQGYQWQKIHIPVLYDNSTQTIKGLISATHNKQKITGAYEYNHGKDKGFCFLKNKTDVAIPDNNYWTIPAGSLQCAVQKKKKNIHVSYALDCVHNKTQEKHSACGLLVSSNHNTKVQGFFDDYVYHVLLDRSLFLQEAVCKNKNNENTCFMHCHAVENKTYDFILTHDFCTDMVRRMGYETTGIGSVKGTCTVRYPEISAMLTSENMTMRLFDMHNFATGYTVSLQGDIASHRITFLKMLVTFSQGCIESHQGWMQWKGGVHFDSYIPFQYHDCFLQYGQDVYALASGSMVYQKMHNQEKLFGFIGLRSLQLRGTHFFDAYDSQKVLKDSFLSSMQLDVLCTTKNLFSVALPQINTQGIGNFTLQGTPKNPEIRGTLTLKKGAFIFPACTLPFTQATLHIVPQQEIDPVIELYAQGRVKRYMVSLGVHGSVRAPHIFLHSVPALSEEQIISLLLTGSEHGSLNIMVPALVMKNFENFLFGSTKRFFKDNASYSWLLKPLEKMSFSPYFTDQSGRGGLKGLLEIEISERFRAVLEKNLSLPEDMAVEIEYLISDDTSLKISKDERGDIGAEVEMRFKF